MTARSETDEAVVAELVALEDERCRAFRELDDAAMDSLLTDDYSHVHMNGRMEDKAAFMAVLKDRQRVIRREGLMVRVHGDAVIMTGRMISTMNPNTDKERVVDSFATQTWLRQGGRWKLAAIQVCPYEP